MSNQTHVELLLSGRSVWNSWRENNPDETPDLSEIRLNDVNLDSYDLRKAELNNSVLRKVSLRGADLREADLREASFEHSAIEGAFFNNANLLKTSMVKVSVENSEFQSANLEGARLTDSELIEVDFRRANLHEVDFDGINIVRSKFEHADVSYAKFDRSTIKDAVFESVKFYGSTFMDVDISKSSIRDSNATMSEMVNCKWSDVQTENLNCQNVKFSSVSLVRTELIQTSFQESSFENVSFTSVKLNGSKLIGARFKESKLEKSVFSNTICESVVCENSELIDVDYCFANLSRSAFRENHLKRVDFQSALLELSSYQGSKFDELWFTSRNSLSSLLDPLDEFQLSGSYFIDQAVDVARNPVAPLADRTLRARRNLLIIAIAFFAWGMGVRYTGALKAGVVQATGVTVEVLMIILGTMAVFFLLQFIVLALEDFKSWQLGKTTMAVPEGNAREFVYQRHELEKYTKTLKSYNNRAIVRFYVVDLVLPILLIISSVVGLWVVPGIVWWG